MATQYNRNDKLKERWIKSILIIYQ